ncbi:transcriptional regulator [Clostridia bacterium]|nr:transcriptional regulator [Clostridia bacterium]
MNYNVNDLTKRLREARESAGIIPAEMAEKTGVSAEEYDSLENGGAEISVSFLNSCAEVLGMDFYELLTGETPKLGKCTIVKKGEGLPIDRRAGFDYLHLAPNFRHKKAEPLFVRALYSEEEQTKPIHLSKHDGFEMNYILRGKLRFRLGGNETILEEGDCAYYDSKNPHGMIAADKDGCEFLAILM